MLCVAGIRPLIRALVQSCSGRFTRRCRAGSRSTCVGRVRLGLRMQVSPVRPSIPVIHADDPEPSLLDIKLVEPMAVVGVDVALGSGVIAFAPGPRSGGTDERHGGSCP